jgi:hypothetical protein
MQQCNRVFGFLPPSLAWSWQLSMAMLKLLCERATCFALPQFGARAPVRHYGILLRMLECCRELLMTQLSVVGELLLFALCSLKKAQTTERVMASKEVTR